MESLQAPADDLLREDTSPFTLTVPRLFRGLHAIRTLIDVPANDTTCASTGSMHSPGMTGFRQSLWFVPALWSFLYESHSLNYDILILSYLLQLLPSGQPACIEWDLSNAHSRALYSRSLRD